MGLKRLRIALGLSLVVGSSLLGSSAAWATPCIIDTTVNYMALGGTGCTIDGLTFSNFVFSTTTANGGTVTLGNVVPIDQVIGGTTEIGFELFYASNASGAPAGTTATADVGLSYTVSSPLANISDAYASFVGTVSGPGASATLGETLIPNSGPTVTINLPAPGSQTVNFVPSTNGVTAIKDQQDSALPNTMSDSSVLTNAFSTTVPEPGTLALFGLGGLGMAWFGRRRRPTA